MNQLTAGTLLNPLELVTIHGEPLQIPDHDRLVHLQFRRYSGCPVCNLHLRPIAGRHDELRAAGILEAVVFHSSAETMRDFQAEFQFALVGDPDKRLYAAFGVVRKISAATALQPRTFKAAARALTSTPSLRGATGKGEEHRMLPADFLIDTDRRLLAAHYGRFVDDHWSVDDLLELARTARPAVAETSQST
jgi:peroxiredoxin